MTSRHRRGGSQDPDDPGAGQGPDEVARPFMAELPPTPPAGVPAAVQPPRDGASDPAEEVDSETVRPYFVTGGRVHEGLGDFGKVYALTDHGAQTLPSLTFERRQIAELCRTPQSVAELSALLDIPLGVATVLARDLARDGVLVAGEGPRDPAADPALITRLIHAVQAL
ncbi:MAG: DUF742 domain-containing protein [Kineosporiaceae bacterium]